MNIDAMVFWRQVSNIVTRFSGTEASTSYGTPAYKVNKKVFVRLKEDGQTIVVYTEEREKWMKKNPEIFFITDHYKNYPLMLISLLTVKEKDLTTLLLASWNLRAPDSVKKKK